MKKISDIPLLDRPREKLQQKGAQSLSDQELLAILLGSGTQSYDVMTMASRILKLLDKTSANPLWTISWISTA